MRAKSTLLLKNLQKQNEVMVKWKDSVITIPPASGFLKFDDGKTEWDLLPMDVMEHVVKVFMYGAKKYAKNNWRKGADWNRYYNAAIRHMVAWQSRVDNDPESGLHHLDHALCSLIMLRGQILANTGKDDRS